MHLDYSPTLNHAQRLPLQVPGFDRPAYRFLGFLVRAASGWNRNCGSIPRLRYPGRVSLYLSLSGTNTQSCTSGSAV